ncbi:hypothetical protein P9112_012647 [Eukaryota sp. TZLM1-RC]
MPKLVLRTFSQHWTGCKQYSLCCCRSTTFLFVFLTVQQSKSVSTNRNLGVKSVSSSYHNLLLTFSGEVYGWGCNDRGRVPINGPETIQVPSRLLLTNMFPFQLVNITPLHSLLIVHYLVGTGSTKISFFCAHGDSDLVVKEKKKVGPNLDLLTLISRIPVNCYIRPRNSLNSPFLLDFEFLYVIDANDEIWRFDKGHDDVPFNNKPTKCLGLSSIVSVSGFDGIYVAIGKKGKVFVWGDLSRMSDVYEDSEETKMYRSFY